MKSLFERYLDLWPDLAFLASIQLSFSLEQLRMIDSGLHILFTLVLVLISVARFLHDFFNKPPKGGSPSSTTDQPAAFIP